MRQLVKDPAKLIKVTEARVFFLPFLSPGLDWVGLEHGDCFFFPDQTRLVFFFLHRFVQTIGREQVQWSAWNLLLNSVASVFTLQGTKKAPGCFRRRSMDRANIFPSVWKSLVTLQTGVLCFDKGLLFVQSSWVLGSWYKGGGGGGRRKEMAVLLSEEDRERVVIKGDRKGRER